MRENELAAKALAICFDIHSKYGPGLLESVYEELFCWEWVKTGVPFVRQKGIPLVHEAMKLNVGFRADLILDDLVLLELKSIEALADVHFKQVLTYLRLANLKLGLLINFNEAFLKNGIRRIVNRL
jgi:GxxExxY protein